MKFLDLFSGIGGFHTGLESLGHECVGYVEWDELARNSYEAMYDTENLWSAHDITQVSDEQWLELKGNVDIITGGSPCQSFSISGKRGGFEDTRGTMFFEYAKAVKLIQPKYFLYENVKGLISHDKQKTIKTMLKTFYDIGYVIDLDVFNSKNYGVPQNRERIFILGKRKDLVEDVFKYTLRSKKALEQIKSWANENVSVAELLPDNTEYPEGLNLNDILEDNLSESCYLSDEKSKLIMQEHYDNKFSNSDLEIKHSKSIFTTSVLRKVRNSYGKAIRKDYEKGNVSIQRHKMTYLEPKKENISNTLSTVQKDNYILEELIEHVEPDMLGKLKNPNFTYVDTKGYSVLIKARVRSFTPLECFRLQGFTDEQFMKAKEVSSNRQLYRQTGNSVTVNVIQEIVAKLMILDSLI